MNLIVSPRCTVGWPEFLSRYPKYSIALDGFVRGAPAFEPEGPHVNFNHHEDVDRLATRSSAGQVFMGIKMGLMETFPPDKSTIYVNDCDQDVCLAAWLLKNSDRLVAGAEPMVNRLVWLSDVMDSCAGAYPLQLDSDMMKQMAWIYQPYVENRNSVPTMDAWQMSNVIEAVGARIRRHLMGDGEKIDLFGKFECLFRLKEWDMVRETGAYARTGMKVAGIKAFVSVRDAGYGEVAPGKVQAKFAYTIGLLTPFAKFPIQKVYEALNEVEFQRLPAMSHAALKAEIERGEGWGGSNTIGGGPRKGSWLSPEKVKDTIEKVINRA